MVILNEEALCKWIKTCAAKGITIKQWIVLFQRMCQFVHSNGIMHFSSWKYVCTHRGSYETSFEKEHSIAQLHFLKLPYHTFCIFMFEN